MSNFNSQKIINSKERNGYKKIVEMYDSDDKADSTNVLEQRVVELENIISEYKKQNWNNEGFELHTNQANATQCVSSLTPYVNLKFRCCLIILQIVN
jgi:hypothetical protein